MSAPASTSAPIVSLGPRELLDANPDAVFACDHDGTVLWLNRAFETLTGRPAADFIGRPALGLVAPTARGRALHAFLRQRRRRTPVIETGLALLDADGGELRVEIRMALVEHADGEMLQLGSARPATIQPPVAAQPCGPAAANLLATLSHASRTYMDSVMGMAGLLLQSELRPEQRTMVGVICDSGQSLLGVVGNAIEYVKLESGTLDLERIAFDLRVAVGETAAILEAEARERELDFACQVHHEVPSLLWGDPGRLRQILLHLGRNAIRLSTGGRVGIEIERLREDEHAVTVRFGVTGARSAVDASDVADPRGGESTDPGFDVLVVRRLIELMGGATETDSVSGGTTRFRFDLTLELQAPHEKADGGQLSRSDLAGVRTLVVISSAVMRRTFVARLETLGCQVAEAERPADALALLREATRSGAPIRLALIDRELASEDGEELGAAIRADRTLDGTYTLLFTSVGRRGDAARARERGFSAYLATTIETDELAEALCEVLHRPAPVSGAAPAPLVTRYSLVEARRGRTRILVVEDSTVNQLVTQWALNRLGYRVEIVGAAAAARSAWLASSFDVAVVDARLPDADSLSLVKELRARTPGRRTTVFVAMVDEDTEATRARWREAEVTELITKPVDLETMTALVERVTRTATTWGPEVEDGAAASRASAVGSRGESGGKVEVVMPDVDQLLTESDVQSAMAKAAQTAMALQSTSASLSSRTAEALGRGNEIGGPKAEMNVAIESASVPMDVAPVVEASPLPDLLTANDVETLQAPDATPAQVAAEGDGFGTAIETSAVSEAPREPESEVPARGEPDVGMTCETTSKGESEPCEIESTMPAPISSADDSPIGSDDDEMRQAAPPAEMPAAPLGETSAEPRAEVPERPETPHVVPAAALAEVPERAEAPHAMPAAALGETSAEPLAEVPERAEAPHTMPAGPAGSDHPPILDLEQLEQSSMGITSLRDAMLAAFLGEVRPRLDRLTRAVSTGDAERVRTEAHSLCMLAGTIGARRCAEGFAEIERRGAGGELEGTVVLLRSAYVEVIRAEEQATRLRDERMAA